VILLKEFKDVTHLSGNKEVGIRPSKPLNALARCFLNELSVELRKSNESKLYPDLMAFAFWCRRANIDALQTKLGYQDQRLGHGLVFHIAPSNVPLNFAYSFAFGLLAGNSNIVKISSKDFPQIGILCGFIDGILNRDQFTEIRKRTAFIKYSRNDEVTAYLSSQCNVRVIWGGDSTIEDIRKHPLPVRSVDIAFADRFSFCVIDADRLIELPPHELNKVAARFYNDTYLVDQNACSSPHLVIWLGKGKQRAKNDFWQAVYKYALSRYELHSVSAVDKYVKLCHSAINVDNISFQKHGNLIYRLGLHALPVDFDQLRGNCGYFYEYETDDLGDISHIVDRKYQTLTYFGVDKLDLMQYVIKNKLMGIDRIVPIGDALDMNFIWDGYDVIGTLSRIIDYR
jgi:hypothetical protein